jgi:hypothetical protein
VGAVPRRQGRGNVAQAAGPEGSIPNFIHVSAGKNHEVTSWTRSMPSRMYSAWWIAAAWTSVDGCAPLKPAAWPER